MSTAFGLSFSYAEFSDGGYGADGKWTDGAFSSSEKEGSVHSMNAKECLSYSMGSRNSGYVKVISSEKLKSGERGKGEGGFVLFAGNAYRLETENPFINGIIPHYEYVGNLVPKSETPSEVEALL